MDQSCDRLASSVSAGSPKPHFMQNPFEADFLHEFHSPDLDKLFIDCGNEGHYAFTLHVDFFNPEGMNLCGAWSLSSIISMACLNLPLEIQYKPENMYLAGVIPGPRQPSLESLNHYLRPLIQDLADSWEHGVCYSAMANHPKGHVTHSAVGLVVCDLPTAHHVGVFAGVGSHFICTGCNCYHKTSYGRVYFMSWTPWDKNKLHAYAEQWRDAATTSECEHIFKEHGVCYSELWQLPYWDPASQLVVDSMHCIL